MTSDNSASASTFSASLLGVVASDLVAAREGV